MPDSPRATCPACGVDLVLEMDPASPPDTQAVVLLADPPYRFVCPSGCAAPYAR